eukprot:SAG11_NODE_18998_length_476_cov_0.867374_1_plen_57_part_10
MVSPLAQRTHLKRVGGRAAEVVAARAQAEPFDQLAAVLSLRPAQALLRCGTARFRNL